MKSYVVVIALAGVLLALAVPGNASAGTPLAICNQTSEGLTVAIGYHSSGVNDTAGSNILTGPFVSRGFWTVNPGKCQQFDNPFNARYMFWFGISKSGKIFDASGSDHFCVSINPFTFEDENVSEDACTHSQTGVRWVGVRAVDLMVDPTVNFNGQ
jgi:uncharacterized membrane protein